ncbi:hypothetical protein NX773_19505 [Massilia solisilvae]|uniref:Histidine kinase n=1 Tax=Massilia solisilvae TaxID=1811225 RepID=A0ABT2BPB3_9BURK|nr:hypothetical protein [Massilia solisilvae]MCS0610358.1 hypothetical protein [Massilia solisilvae]
MIEEKRDPRAKFLELANARVSRTIKDLRLVGNLLNRKNYEYTNDEAKKIIRALEAELDILKLKLKNQSNDKDEVFRL